MNAVLFIFSVARVGGCCSLSTKHIYIIKQIVIVRVRQSDVAINIFSQPTLCFLAWVAFVRVLFLDIGFFSWYLLDPGHHQLQQDARFRVQCKATWENEWRHNITIVNNPLPKHHDVDWMFSFNQYEYKSVLKLTPKHGIIFVFKLSSECYAVQYAVTKFLEKWILSWCCFPHRQRPIHSSLMYSRQNPKQIKHIREINHLAIAPIYIYIYILFSSPKYRIETLNQNSKWYL